MMKGDEYLAREWAESWSKPISTEAVDALSHAYLMGFRKAKEMAAGMVFSFNNPRTMGIAHLIRAIGTAEVHPRTGKPRNMEEA